MIFLGETSVPVAAGIVPLDSGAFGQERHSEFGATPLARIQAVLLDSRSVAQTPSSDYSRDGTTSAP
ncbi:MAG: hypothetical protein ACJA2W_003325 [Planctomycetota bacterium]|jgi:hypothetical protein